MPGCRVSKMDMGDPIAAPLPAPLPRPSGVIRARRVRGEAVAQDVQVSQPMVLTVRGNAGPW